MNPQRSEILMNSHDDWFLTVLESARMNGLKDLDELQIDDFMGILIGMRNGDEPIKKI